VSKTFLVLSLGWNGPLPSSLPMTSCLGRGDIYTVTTIISSLLQFTTPSLTQDVKPNCKHIRTKCLNYYYLIQSLNVDLSLRPYITILMQIDHNLQGCIIKVVLVLTSIPYQISKILKSNILKIIGIKILYPLYTFNPSYTLVDHLLTPNRSRPMFHRAKSSDESRSNS
jgi:hypothetical protein